MRAPTAEYDCRPWHESHQGWLKQILPWLCGNLGGVLSRPVKFRCITFALTQESTAMGLRTIAPTEVK